MGKRTRSLAPRVAASSGKPHVAEPQLGTGPRAMRSYHFIPLKDLSSRLHSAVQAGSLLQSSATNIHQMLTRSESTVVQQSIADLVEAGAWDELNDRFFKTLAFGTGGLRGRTIGKIVTAEERGTPQPLDRPQWPCV